LNKICWTGGGTGGHIYPALALVFALQERQGEKIEHFWIGQNRGMDRAIVEAAGIRFYGISAGKLRRSFSIKNIIDCFKVIAGFFAARRILKYEKPGLLFSKGGFVSVPPVFAAATLGIPVHTHESDFSAGLATKLNSFFASRIWLAYSETALCFSSKIREKCRECGNPVRAAFRSASAEKGRAFIEQQSAQKIPHQKKILLVLGGSQGAREVNLLVRESLNFLTRHFFIVHQTGIEESRENAEFYFDIPYIKDEMPDVLASAALVIGRSGAGTVWESAAAGIPMVLIPLAGSGTRGDQIENARYFERHGAALVLIHPERAEFETALEMLINDEGRLDKMAAAAKKLGAFDATKIILEEIS
jgi:UDP-N-acetylglucosamine--N-acetylmuramyl-(pentapeptide) pyrophosphoryl-undecaprenol N-acetylglucosamine transferase